MGAPKIASSQYLFLTGDPRIAQENLIQDVQKGTMDARNLSAAAQSSLQQLLNSSVSPPPLAALGKLKSVCPTLIVAFPNGSKLAFRAVHDNGSMDWVITVSREPEIIQYIAFLPSKSGRPPAILPPYTPGGADKLLPSVEMDCLPVSVKPASNEEIQQACQKWPGMCK
jgi:hypothetical protein